VLLSQAEAEVLNRTRRPKPNSASRVRFKAEVARSVERQPDSVQEPNLDDAPLGPTRAKKGRGRAASPTVGGSRGATFVALCPYVSSVVGADVGAARLWRLPADLFPGRPMAVTDIAPRRSSALSDTAFGASARAPCTKPPAQDAANRTGLPLLRLDG